MAICKLFIRILKIHNAIPARSMCGYLQVEPGESEICSISYEKPTNVLQRTHKDLSDVTPFLSNTFNLAAYVNHSKTLQNLIDLNVNISKFEKKPYIIEKLLKLDFEKNMKSHIVFLSDYVNMEQMGEFFTKNPMIFCEHLEDLKTRVNYLESKRFSDSEIKRIISKNPYWLNFSTIRIDRRFGFYQQYFDLSGKNVRCLATTQPKLITYNLHHVKCNTFAIKEEMGFKDEEIKLLLLNKPKLWMINQRMLIERFNYIHNIMKIPHTTILENAGVLLSRVFRIKQRHLFLQSLGRAQYDPKKVNYVPIKALVEKSDVEFCNNFAKCDIDDFNMFLKTL
ncbi:transcription termination factor 3, mitochondrial isoform X1 [Bombyx mori]|uniref:Transcription termination factor 3, mitochondrial n=1 Tax=Bombyx mori TaxID=7091 RepID=A0A8R2QWI8_BOMMO|nr:transcription termination factor 3, mitochondrial [Bombyx mori]XP_037866634.1 transcription termination factor 3, mitochondrial [Bombyx mori]XP_037866635.1 transcription termination factor 3, mitochondrial [Bombyx mori]